MASSETTIRELLGFAEISINSSQPWDIQMHDKHLYNRVTRFLPGSGRSLYGWLGGDALGLATLDMGEGIGPAIHSRQLAAEAIINGGTYSVASIPRYSWPNLLFSHA